ncbi:MAG: hypothetical protein JEY99_18980 [Spirochaetales bacterium]|nr:hypothetical protein [Spirochaetales bacterium]
MHKYERTPFPKIPYDTEKIKLTRIFESPSLTSFPTENISCEKTEQVYGPLNFPELPKDRPYLFASMVLSVDGKIAFEDDPEGPLIAQLNKMDPDGGAADFWLLNMLRMVSDGSMGCGGPADVKEKSETAKMFGVDFEGSGGLFDQDLEDARLAAGLHPVPWGIITSLDGSEIGFNHPALNNHPLLPVMVTTSPNGMDRIKSKCRAEYFVVEDPEKVPAPEKRKGMPVIITGEGSMPDAGVTMKILKKMGINKILIEGPTYTHHLMQLGMLDEMFLNYSCVYVGGKALSLGMRGESFTSKNHPHTEMLSIHTHGPHFFYLRHKMIYNQ